ncbi:MAG: RNA-binding S4 domain-containing protein [Clostridia bacterium]|nr:RNA-binding S4 domain-containing protein [Clostridia bacterium]
MRLDKYLKVSRIIKRRTVANEACDGSHVTVNGRPAKPSYDVKMNDVIEIGFGSRLLRVRVTSIMDSTKKADAAEMYEVLSD